MPPVTAGTVWPTAVGQGVLIEGDYTQDGRFDLWISDHPLLRHDFESGGLGDFLHN